MHPSIEAHIRESIATKERLLSEEADHIAAAAAAIVTALKAGGKILVFGNGGSAADSQHFVAELVGRFKQERRPFAAIALTTNTSTITAIGNDYGYDAVFVRQIEALGRKGDVAFGISTSGTSKNVIEAMRAARRLGMVPIGLVGGSGGALKKECTVTITAPSNATPCIQESHITAIHIICELVEKGLA